MSEQQPMVDEEAIRFLKAVLAANDTTYTFWDQEKVDFRRKMYQNRAGYIPTIDQAASVVGFNRAEQMIGEILEWKKFDNMLKGYNDPCHFCGGTNKLMKWRFGLAAPKSFSYSKEETAISLASVALGALTLPLLGQALVHLPGQSFKGVILRLVMCADCRKKNSNFLGVFMPAEKYKVHHPMYETLYKMGFTKYIPYEKLAPEDIMDL